MTGEQILSFMAELEPHRNSLTGEGTLSTLRDVGKRVPGLQIESVPSGYEAFGWTVPDEWECSEAWIEDASGNRIIDYADHPLHVVGYSVPVDVKISGKSLRAALCVGPGHIPYKTSYYQPRWGFCITDETAAKIDDDAEYHAVIRSTLKPGKMHWGELLIPGETIDEILLTTYICHPAMANDNLSGIAILTALAQWLQSEPRRYTYRLLWIPETIGSIVWLHQNRHAAIAGERIKGRGTIKGGMVVSCCGGPGYCSYKTSRSGKGVIDRVMQGPGKKPFDPIGSDERQFNSPGFDLPIGWLYQAKAGTYPEYHTSADNLDFVTPHQLSEAYRVARAAISEAEQNRTYTSTHPYCEPPLRDMYPSEPDAKAAMMWVLNLADGKHDMIDIQERSGCDWQELQAAAAKLLEAGWICES